MALPRSLALAAMLLGVAGLPPALGQGALTAEAWSAHRTETLNADGLLRYYPLDALPEGGVSLEDAGNWGNELRLGVAGGPPGQTLATVPGRWPGKPAVRLDTTYLSANPYAVEGRAFTAEAWVRTHGLGTMRGDSIPTGGTLLSLGGGYWDGWRVTIHYPDRGLGFEIGRPAPSSSMGLGGGGMADEAWHHLAVTWDGSRMSVYLNGRLTGSGEYTGDFTPANPGTSFRLGFAGFGWGSAILDVDEVALWSRALSGDEVLAHSLAPEALPEALAARLRTVREAWAREDYAGAQATLRQIVALPDLDPGVEGLARLWLSEALSREHQGAAAAAELTVMLGREGVPEGLRAQAMAQLIGLAVQGQDIPSSLYQTVLKEAGTMSASDQLRLRLNLARAYRREGNVEAARQEYEAAVQAGDVPVRDLLELRLQWAHSLAQTGDLEGALQEYRALAQAAEAPAQYRSYARLCTAAALRMQRKWRDAVAEYDALLAEANIPPTHRLEAAECRAETQRQAQGLPARDPEAGRVKLAACPAAGVEFWVSPAGDDGNPGTEARPFASLERAQRAVRRTLAGDEAPDGSVVVNLLPGLYPRTESLVLEAQDSGTQRAPVIYRSVKPGAAILSGGAAVTGFEPVTDEAILARLPQEARGKVYQANLMAQGISEYGELPSLGYGRAAAPVLEIYFDGKPLRLARWPNEGWLHTATVLDDGTTSGRPVFTVSEDRMGRWSQAHDAWAYGYWRWLWADDSMPVAAFDPAAGRITLARNTSAGAVTGGPYYVLNLLEELDRPGEWYLDRETGMLYLYPPSDPAQARVEVSMLATPMVQMTGCANVRLEGLTLELGRSDGVVMEGATDCLVAGCVVRRLAGSGVIINGGSGDGVFGSELYDLGRNGTSVKGGDRRTLAPAGHFVENCEIHHFSRLARTYTPAVFMDGVGNRIAHNSFHDTPCHAIRLEGNDHVVEYNDVFHVVQESDDQGGLDMWFNHGYRGNLLRFNYWHDITAGERPCGRAGIRLDDAISGTVVYGNIFQRCSQAGFGGLQIHGGKDNWVENNLFADCTYGISFSGWGADGWKRFIESEGTQNSLRKDINMDAPPYSTRYPELAGLLENEGRSFVWRNLALNCGEFLTRDRGIQDQMDNTVTSENPGFVDPERGDFRLKPGAQLLGDPGFRPIPFEEIGQYEHPLRAVRPQ